MKIRAKRLSILTIAFCLLLPTQSFAAIKSGDSCTKVGKTTTQSGYKYFCIKKNGKLVWGNPVKDTKPTPTPSPTLAYTPAQWQQVQFDLLAKLKSLKPETIQKLNFIYSPKSKAAVADKLKDSYQEPITLLSSLYVSPTPVTFLVMNETERDWWISQVKALGSNQEESWWGGHCVPNQNSHCGYGTSPNPDGSFHFGQLLGSNFQWRDNDYTIAYHESIHVYQLSFLGTAMRALPYWFAEGQANYLGFTFSHKFVDSRIQRNGAVEGLVMKFPELKAFTNEQWVNWLQRLGTDSEFTFNNSLGYSAGELLCEVLYRDYGYTKIHEWLSVIKAGDSWQSAFNKAFKIDYDMWLRDKAAPYLNSQI
jgi:hypothetical protein